MRKTEICGVFLGVVLENGDSRGFFMNNDEFSNIFQKDIAILSTICYNITCSLWSECQRGFFAMLWRRFLPMAADGCPFCSMNIFLFFLRKGVFIRNEQGCLHQTERNFQNL